MNTKHLRRIKKVSRVLQLICWLVLILFLSRHLIGWLIMPHDPPLGFALSPNIQQLGIPLALAAYFPFILLHAYMLFAATRLFRCFSRGNIFTADSVSWISRFAWAGFLATLNYLLVPLYMTILSQWSATEFENAFPLILRSSDLMFLLFSSLFVVLSWVLVEAKKQSDDLQLIV